MVSTLGADKKEHSHWGRELDWMTACQGGGGPGGGGYSLTIAIRVCAAQRGCIFGTPI